MSTEIVLGQNAVEATTRILRQLFEAILANEAGTMAGVDGLFLHDFRVAIRRTRSALDQFQDVFGPLSTTRYRTDLKWLGTVTGSTRDIDVLDQKLQLHGTDLGAEIGANLDDIIEWVVSELEASRAQLARELSSERYRQFKQAWSAFLEGGFRQALGPSSQRPVLDIANERISVAYHRALEAGSRVIEQSLPAEELHRLRIHCKKLRYLMEFFCGLYPEQSVAPLIADLKQLQDNLGDFNDLRIQLAWFGRLRRSIEEGEHVLGRETCATLGRLIEFFEYRQEEERARFRARFDLFARPVRQAAFRSLYGC